jgi:hypothetical protein
MGPPKPAFNVLECMRVMAAAGVLKSVYHLMQGVPNPTIASKWPGAMTQEIHDREACRSR